VAFNASAEFASSIKSAGEPIPGALFNAGDRHHVAAGCWFAMPEEALRTIRQGARFVVFSNDGLMLQNAMAAAFTRLRQR
jgi:hypothetical protein